REFACCAVDGEGADASALLSFVVANLIDRVEEALVWVHREKRRIDGLYSQAERSQLRGVGFEAIGADPLTCAAFLGVGADVYEIVFVCGLRRGTGANG